MACNDCVPAQNFHNLMIKKTAFLLLIGLNFLASPPLHAQQSLDSTLAAIAAENPRDTLDAAAILRGEAQYTREQWLRRQRFIDNIFIQNPSLYDSALFFRLQQNSALSLNQSELRSLSPRVDNIDERLRREQIGAPSLFNVGNLIGAGMKYLAEKLGAGGAQPLAVIPSELEIDVMKVLWQQPEATTSTIYAKLDSTRLTAVDLQSALDAMAERGLLERRLISPRHEFTILGAISLEMSAQNRKNREYLYRPQVTRQTMLAFLDATAFSQRLASPTNHSAIAAHLHKLMSRLVMAE
jgi:predicted transcriptional regulator